jgi:hypothetical protein
MGDSKFKILFRWDIQVIQYSFNVLRVFYTIIQKKHKIRHNPDLFAYPHA